MPPRTLIRACKCHNNDRNRIDIVAVERQAMLTDNMADKRHNLPQTTATGYDTATSCRYNWRQRNRNSGCKSFSVFVIECERNFMFIITAEESLHTRHGDSNS